MNSCSRACRRTHPEGMIQYLLKKGARVSIIWQMYHHQVKSEMGCRSDGKGDCHAERERSTSVDWKYTVST